MNKIMEEKEVKPISFEELKNKTTEELIQLYFNNARRMQEIEEELESLKKK